MAAMRYEWLVYGNNFYEYTEYISLFLQLERERERSGRERETREMLSSYQKQREPPSQSPNLARAKASSVSVC